MFVYLSNKRQINGLSVFRIVYAKFKKIDFDTDKTVYDINIISKSNQRKS
jgi:hypothetical protein